MKLVLVAKLSYLNGFGDYAESVRESLAQLLAPYPAETKSRIARLIHGCSIVDAGTNYQPPTNIKTSNRPRLQLFQLSKSCVP